MQFILIVMLLRRTLNCDSDLPGGSFDKRHSMAVLLIDAFSIIILNLPLPGSSFYYDTSCNSFDCGIHWKYFCLWNFMTILCIVTDSTLDMSVIFFGSPFGFDTPWKYFCWKHSTAILLIVVLPGSIRLDSYFHFCKLECSIVIIPDYTILLYSLAVIFIVILPGIRFHCKNPRSNFDFGTPSHFF